LSAVEPRQEPETRRFPDTGQDIRIIRIEGEPWFIAADVAAVLDLGNVHSSIALLDDDEKGLHTMETVRGPQSLVVVSEPGLYSLILRSRKPEAKAFKRWLVHEVLPAIRRTGIYGAAAAPAFSDALAALTPRDFARMILAESDRADGAERHAAAFEAAAGAWNALGDATGDFSLKEAALILTRDHGIEIGQNRLMKSLARLGMIDDRGRPYARHNAHLVARPLTWTHPSGEPRLSYQIRVTILGLEYLRRRLGPEVT
jgi:prophage antirepressor-like protein